MKLKAYNLHLQQRAKNQLKIKEIYIVLSIALRKKENKKERLKLNQIVMKAKAVSGREDTQVAAFIIERRREVKIRKR